MTLQFPTKFRVMPDGRMLVANDVGDFFFCEPTLVERMASDTMYKEDKNFLIEEGFIAPSDSHLSFTSYLQRWVKRQTHASKISYVILVPTLRCNLNCSYCQVSRVAEEATGFDWDELIQDHVLNFLAQLKTTSIKIEFQGGEPTLRPDIMQTVAEYCRSKFEQTEFIVCTNLQVLSRETQNFLAGDDVFVSTSLDGDQATHQVNRTVTQDNTNQFLNNLQCVMDEYGSKKVSALPTIDLSKPFDPAKLYTAYASFGLSSVYFRPINFQGFARKKHAGSHDGFGDWKTAYFQFLDFLVEKHHEGLPPMEEYYFTHCLRRFIQSEHDNHVDLRNPSPFGSDYVVIDYDGSIYPTDEARMLTRVGQVDLSIGNISDGINETKVSQLNWHNLNHIHEECIHCPYQYACGTDLVDDLSRYQRIDVPKHATWFCQQHLAIFDRIATDLATNNRGRLSVYENWLNLPEHALSDGVISYDSTDY